MFINEKVVQTNLCTFCSISFYITDTDLEFYEKVSPVFGGKKYLVPSPTLCPDCRRQRRLSWRNESKLYKNTCAAIGKDVVSIYSPDKKFIIYNQDYWWSDAWNPLDYGKAFDFEKSFFTQFSELQAVVPRIALLNGFQENADYANHSYHNKNSYLVNSCGYVEDCYYCINTTYSNDCIDCYNGEYCSQSYELTDCQNCTFCSFLLYCRDCFKSILCESCVDCKNCIGCKGLSNKEYYIFNKPASKEEFEKLFNDFFKNPITQQEIRKVFKELQKTVPSKGERNLNSSNVFASDNCINSKNLKHCFECNDSENVAFSFWMGGGGAKDCYDYDIYGEKSSLIYETHCSGGETSNILFSNIVWGGHHNVYCDLFLSNASNCFGCIGLHGNEQYCILNTQYTKEEYEELVPKIIEHMIRTGEWGQFFPASLSPFGYNESISNEWFPLSRLDVIPANAGIYKNESNHLIDPRTKNENDKSGTFLHGPIFNWSDYEAPFPKVEKVIPASRLPDDITKIPDDILNWAIECEVTKKPFRIIKQELEFYRKHNLPIPRRHPDQRHLDRMQLRNPRKIFTRECEKCKKIIDTSYAPERPERVYCESCYNKEIY